MAINQIPGSNTAQALNHIEKASEKIGNGMGKVVAKLPFYGMEAAAMWGGAHVGIESAERFGKVVTGQLDLGKDAVAEPVLQAAGSGFMVLMGASLFAAGAYGAVKTTQDLVQGEKKAQQA